MTEYWYNMVTGEVEDGPQALGSDRVGPFATREEAARALETLRARSAQWAAEEEREDDWSAARGDSSGGAAEGGAAGAAAGAVC